MSGPGAPTPEEIRSWRQRLGLSLQEAADALGVAERQTIWRWEQEEGSPHHRSPANPTAVRALMEQVEREAPTRPAE